MNSRLISTGVDALLHALPRSRLRMIGYLGMAGSLGLFLTVLSLFLGWPTAFGVVGLVAVAAPLLTVAFRTLDVGHMKRRASRLTEQARLTYTDATFTSWTEWRVERDTHRRVEAYRAAHPETREVVLGQIDRDGRVRGPFGALPWLKQAPEEAFVTGLRSSVAIVLRGDDVLVRKDFRSNRARFVREWFNLALLYGRANVPAVYEADEAHNVIYKNLIPGRTIRDVLVEAGANILLTQTEHDPALAALENAARIKAVWARGQEKLPACLSEAFLHHLEQEMDRVHACGVARLSLTYGNVIVDAQEGKPWFIDLEGAQAYRSTQSLAFVFQRDQDREKFNQIYGRHVPTQR